MPITKEEAVTAKDLRKGDKLMAWDKDKVVTGKTVASRGMLIEKRVPRTKNWEIHFSNGQHLVAREHCTFWVEREVPTEEEKAASERAYMDRSIRRKMDSALRDPQGIRDQIRELLDKPTHRDGEDIMQRGQALMAAQALENVWLDVLAITLDEEREVDLVDAYQMVKEHVTRRLLSNGADDTWSGRGNDARRVVFDELRKFASDQWF